MSDALRDGRFVALSALGEGSQGRTFDGVDKREGRPVAIKRFDVRGARTWKDVELAEREARVLRELHHPKLPAYVDHFEDGGALYLVMEKIEGESLSAMRKRGAVLGERDVLQLLADAADVLAYLHGRAPAVIHRDLKPGNVIRRPDGTFAFVDFGAVRDKLRPEGGSTVVGTFGYMAPEQFQGRALPGSDVYAIGATALGLLTGLEPEELPHKGLGIDVRAALRGRASERLIDVLEQMLEIDPDKRAQSIGPLLEGLERPAKKRGKAKDWEREIEEGARTFEREMKHAARNWEREARQRERGTRKRRRARRGARWPLALLATIALTLAIPLVGLTLRVLVPLVLTLLSLFFARQGLLRARERVREAGERAVASLVRARMNVQQGLTPARDEEQPRVRLKPGDEPRVRVVTPADEEAAAEEEEEEWERERRKN